jgi:hypothetical protein
MDPSNTQSGAPAMAVGCREMCRAGFFVQNARNIKLRRVDLYHQLGPAITVEQSRDITVADLHATADDIDELVVIDGEKTKLEGLAGRSVALTIPTAIKKANAFGVPTFDSARRRTSLASKPND